MASTVRTRLSGGTAVFGGWDAMIAGEDSAVGEFCINAWLEWNSSYSYWCASVGCRAEARRAGRNPKRIPMLHDTTSETTTEIQEIGR